jgi:hypothetical protein
MAAVAEFAARHTGTSLEDEFAADELAAELHLTRYRRPARWITPLR